MAALADRYDGFILDLWGVIHDGVHPYEGAADCLRGCRRPASAACCCPTRRAAPQPPRRCCAAWAWPDLYHGAADLGRGGPPGAARPHRPWFAALGRRVWHLGPERDRNVMEGLGLEPVGTPAEAEFVLNTGPDDHRGPQDVAAFEDVLAECARHGLPMICANPDLEVIRGGVRVICAGALAARYEQMGGAVRSLGKPDPAIYRPVLDMLGTAKHRTLAVGDSLRTDIAGAAAAGLDSCWVLGGIHGEALGDDHGAAAAEAHGSRVASGGHRAALRLVAAIRAAAAPRTRPTAPPAPR